MFSIEKIEKMVGTGRLEEILLENNEESFSKETFMTKVQKLANQIYKKIQETSSAGKYEYRFCGERLKPEVYLVIKDLFQKIKIDTVRPRSNTLSLIESNGALNSARSETIFTWKSQLAPAVYIPQPITPRIRTSVLNTCVGLNRFRKEGKFCDGEIKLKDDSFAVHRAVMAVYSPFFDQLFSSENHCLLTIDVSPQSFEFYLEFVYTGSLPLHEISLGQLSDLVVLAKECGDVNCTAFCHRELEKRINKESFSEFYNLAKKCEDTFLFELCVGFIKTLDASEFKLAELNENVFKFLHPFINLVDKIKDKEVFAQFLKKICLHVNKDNFPFVCKKAIEIKSKLLKLVCKQFVSDNKDLFKIKDMKSSKILYAKLMTGL